MDRKTDDRLGGERSTKRFPKVLVVIAVAVPVLAIGAYYLLEYMAFSGGKIGG